MLSKIVHLTANEDHKLTIIFQCKLCEFSRCPIKEAVFVGNSMCTGSNTTNNLLIKLLESFYIFQKVFYFIFKKAKSG